jgi:S-DNA-T family DNA segregation ATPase FtsK/SpoIIIE
MAREAPLADELPPSPGIDDLAAIAAAARDAAQELNLTPVSPPWLPPLSEIVELADILGLAAASPAGSGDVGSRPSAHLRLPFGLIDLPDEQRQGPVAWHLDGSNLAVVGGPRSGRTTALSTVIQAAALVAGPRKLHVYLLDGTNALAHLQTVPNVEAVVPTQDLERGQRLLRRLSHEVSIRQGSTTSTGSDVIVVIDGWEALTSAWNEVDHGRMLDQLISVFRDGPAVGVFAAISGGRALLTGAVSSLLAERVVLRFADSADAMLAGVPPARVGAPQPAGRGILLRPHHPAGEIQIAVANPTGCPAPLPEVRRGRPGWRIPELAQRLEHHELVAAWRERPSVPDDSGAGRRIVPVGVGGDDAGPVTLDLETAPVTLVIGPPGCGRTSTLRCIAAELRRLGEPVLAVTTVDGPWPGQPIVVDARRPGAGDDLSIALARHPDATVLIDDVPTADPRMTSTAEIIGELMAAHLMPGRPGPTAGSAAQPDPAETRGGRLVVTSTAPEILAAYRGVLAIARTARSGLLLGGPTAGDSEVFGLRLGQRLPGPPGRALLIQSGQVSVVQLALPPPADPRQPSAPFPAPGAAFPQARAAPR